MLCLVETRDAVLGSGSPQSVASVTRRHQAGIIANLGFSTPSRLRFVKLLTRSLFLIDSDFVISLTIEFLAPVSGARAAANITWTDHMIKTMGTTRLITDAVSGISQQHVATDYAERRSKGYKRLKMSLQLHQLVWYSCYFGDGKLTTEVGPGYLKRIRRNECKFTHYDTMNSKSK